MLHDRLRGYLTFFEQLAIQPANRWDGFFISNRDDSDDSNVGLHFQIAFACYALAVFALHPDADQSEQERCRSSMEALITRMLQRRVWVSWGRFADREGIIADPICEDNVQYSGALAMMLGAYEAAGGGSTFDDDFTLLWNSDNRFVYTHTKAVEVIWRQTRASNYYGVASQPGRVLPAHNSHALWAFLLHDLRHASTYAEVNQRVLDVWLRRMTFGGPVLPGRGVLRATYFPRSRFRVTTSTTFYDAWTLALLAPIAPDLVQPLAPRLWRQLRRIPDGTAVLPSATRWRTREQADVSISTGFAYLLAVELNDTALADALLRYADTHFQLVEDEQRAYHGGLATPFTTALFALGEAGGLGRLLSSTVAPTSIPPIPPPVVTEEEHERRL